MKQLATEIKGRGTQRGYTYHLKQRNELIALYTMLKTGASDVYEVIKVRKHRRDMVIQGRVVAAEGDEYYPSSADWGLYGWSYSSLEDAEDKFRSLTTS